MGVVNRWDGRTVAHSKFFSGEVDGPRCKIHARDLVTGDVIVLRPEAY
jgi:hypothetical protein